MNEVSNTKKKGNYQSIIMALLVVVGVGIVIALQAKDSVFGPSGMPRISKGVRAPDFSFPSLDGEMVRLSDFEGKVVFLNVWATWCPPCVEEMPSMETLHRALNAADFKMIAVSVDASGNSAVAPFMKKHGLNFTALTDPEGKIKDLYQTTGVPETFIIGKNGMIVEKIIGPRNWASPEAIGAFQKLIQGQ